ncbi:AraC family transcriptional regulator [Phenylobacterium sp.]|uniref:AraC family transcriptional regulator n=1 Tax=Phenylobacterium sp. TaxID=1871053 RepID=UPI0035B18C4F
MAVAERTYEAGIVRGLFRYAVGRGADPAALTAGSGVDPAALEDPDQRVPFEAYVALMRAAKSLTGDPALALRYAEHVDFSEVSVVGLLTLASRTMLEALEQMNRYGRLAVEVDGVAPAADRFVLSRDGEAVWLTDTRQGPNLFPELTETTFGRMACGPRAMGMVPFVLAVEVTHPDPGYPEDYRRVFEAPVTFGAPRNALRLNPAFLDAPVGRLPVYVFGVLSDRAAALLRKLESAETVRGRVEALLMPVLHRGDIGMEDVAARLGVSRQTLFRRLRAEGVTFEKVCDELRHRLALHYLANPKVSINEAAYLVGFSEPAAFSRAFKRWTGLSPRAFRAGGPGEA